MPEFQRFSYDVLVIGAGGAGLRAAIEAGAAGAKVGWSANLFSAKRIL